MAANAASASARTSAPAARFSLDRPLPPDVVFRSAGWLTSYRNYPVFSATWFWRRTALLVPFVIVIATMQTLNAWSLVDRRAATTYAVGVLLIWLVMITIGPALATIARHERMDPNKEKIAVFIGVFGGVAISYIAQIGASALTSDYLMPRAIAAGTLPASATAIFKPSLQTLIGVTVAQILGFFVLNGGFALHTYVNEKKRLQELQRERDKVDRLQMQKSEVDLRLTVLQAQVEPHFLFNTLASVHSLIRNDPQRAEATLEALVDHLRATLPKMRQGVGSSSATLADQIEVCTSYLEVMKVRLGDRLRYKVEVPSALQLHPFPPLMLISLVENAVKHGIEPSANGGSVTIRAEETQQEDERNLSVSVLNSGKGLRPGLGEGMGLANLKAQLSAQFGARGRLSIGGDADGRTVATLVVPYVEGKQ